MGLLESHKKAFMNPFFSCLNVINVKYTRSISIKMLDTVTSTTFLFKKVVSVFSSRSPYYMDPKGMTDIFLSKCLGRAWGLKYLFIFLINFLLKS